MSTGDAGGERWEAGLRCPSPAVVRGLWSIVLLLVLASGARGQSAAPRVPEVRLYVLADTVALGEAFEIAVAADHAPGVQALFPDVPRDQTAESGPLLVLGGAEATDIRRFAPEASGGFRTDSVVYRALAFAADSARIGPLAVRFATGADTVTVASGVGLVRVRRLVPGPEAEPEPPAEPFPFPSPTPVWILLGALGLAVAALAGWGLWRLLRRPKRQGLAPRPLPYPEALARLDALGASLPSPEASQAWFVALADAVRTYLERRLRMPALEQTTRETDDALQDRVPDDARQAIRGVLRVCDRVKFADLRPGADAAGDALQRAREAVEAVEAHLAAQEAAARAAEAAASGEPRTEPAES